MNPRETLFRTIDQHLRRPAVAQIGGFRPDPGLRSWFGGNFHLPDDVEWPKCGDRWMTPLLQVIPSELPISLPMLEDFDAVQIFVADDFPIDTPTFSSPQFTVLTHKGRPLSLRDAPFEYAAPRPFQIRWSLGSPEGPCWEEAGCFVAHDLIRDYVKADDCFDAYYDRYSQYHLTKVGGWPAYIQGAPSVDADFILQIASEEKPRWMIGDCGSLYFYKRESEWGMHGDCY